MSFWVITYCERSGAPDNLRLGIALRLPALAKARGTRTSWEEATTPLHDSDE